LVDVTRFGAFLFLCLWPAVGSAAINLGPIFYAGRHGEERRIEFLGPLFEARADLPSGTNFLAIRPFYARFEIQTASGEAAVTDFLWPIGTSRRKFDSHRWRFFPIFGYNQHLSDPDSARYIWVFPIIWWGKDQEGVPYFAIFPIGGTIRDIFARDRIDLVLFPLFVHTNGRGRETWDFLFPIFSRTKGEGVHKFRAFPLYGEATWDGQFKNVFFLWPIYHWRKSLDEEHPGRGFLIVPLYGAVDTDVEKRRVYLWPFFRYRNVFEDGKEVDFPWPIFRYASHQDLERRHAWPLWGYTRVGPEKRYFFLWPIFSFTKREIDDDVRTRFWAFPLTWHFYEEEEDIQEEDYRRIWPFYSNWELEDWSRYRALDIWPWKNTRGVEFNWAPFWTFIERVEEVSKEAPLAKEADFKFLWGMVRSRAVGEEEKDFSLFPLWDYSREAEGVGDRKQWSILKGLFGIKRTEEVTETRFLWLLKFKNRHGEKKPAEPVAQRMAAKKGSAETGAGK